MINQQEDNNQNEEQEAENVRFEDKRRFTDDGERVEVKVEVPEETMEVDDTPIEAVPTKSAEVVLLENELTTITERCRAAEDKLIEVQKRFEAERDNLEKETTEMRTRMKRSLEQQADQGRFTFLTSLLPVLDNLNLALSAAEHDTSIDNLLGGVKGTARSFEQALMSVGVKPIESVGDKFDPLLHEAVEMVETDADKDGLITKEFARGYTYKEKLLRPSRVQVGNGAKSQAG